MLCITQKTVKNHVTNLLSRLKLRDRTQAAVFVHSLTARAYPKKDAVE
jgi:DNA-binding NarL/FixJ family response regulator